jgi:hypothetical protein
MADPVLWPAFPDLYTMYALLLSNLFVAVGASPPGGLLQAVQLPAGSG